MAKPNYAFAKRQRDLAKKQKKEDKQQRKALNPDAPLDVPELHDDDALPPVSSD